MKIGNISDPLQNFFVQGQTRKIIADSSELSVRTETQPIGVGKIVLAPDEIRWAAPAQPTDQRNYPLGPRRARTSLASGSASSAGNG